MIPDIISKILVSGDEGKSTFTQKNPPPQIGLCQWEVVITVKNAIKKFKRAVSVVIILYRENVAIFRRPE